MKKGEILICLDKYKCHSLYRYSLRVYTNLFLARREPVQNKRKYIYILP